ncbi:MAG: ytfP [Bacillales bacterium]|nr:ytfP [Bacillales bacterium]
MKFDVIVIGGGPSGLMASIAAAEKGKRILLVDKGNKLGRKLAISGGGRCNVTNSLPVEEVIKHIPGNGKFLYGAFSQFNNQDIIEFFNKLGVKLKEEDHGRMFPVNNDAQSVVDALTNRFLELKGTILTDSPVKDVHSKEGHPFYVLLQYNQVFEAKAVVIAVGGKSVPQTGSTGDGYKWAKKAGHTITDLFPTEVPMTSNEWFIRNKVLQGLSLQDVAVTVWNPKGKALISHRMDMIFTHFGLSGPAILRCSQFVVQAIKKFEVEEVIVSIDVCPDKKEEQLFQKLHSITKDDGKKSVKNGFRGILPERFLLFLLERATIDADQLCNSVSQEKLRTLAKLMKRFEIAVNGTLPIEKAFVTGGGVSIKEIDPKTMGSKLVPNLYFCGEILDIHGYTGGYNITAAMVTGRIAGMNAGQTIR